MYFVSLEIDGFRAIESARVEFGRGLNVLYGPNDLGKSTLAAALRAVLLLPAASVEGVDCVPWHRRDHSPRTVLRFVDDDDRGWRVRKTFGESPSADLEFTKDGVSFSKEVSGREVEEKLRSLLGWGIPGPGGKGGQKGLPESFLAKVLLAQQTHVDDILRESIDQDRDESGKVRLTAALKTLAQDPLFKKVLASAQVQYDRYFSPTGKDKRGKTSPFSVVAEAIKKLSSELDELRKKEDASKSTEAHAASVRVERDSLLLALTEAEAKRERLQAQFERARIRAEMAARLDDARARLRGIEAEIATVDEKATALAALAIERELRAAAHAESVSALQSAHSAVREAEEAVRRATSDDAARERELQRAQLEGKRSSIQASLAEWEVKRGRALAAIESVKGAHGAEAKHQEAIAALASGRAAIEVARTALRDAERGLQHAKGVVAFGRWRSSVAASEESRLALEEARKYRGEADSLTQEVQAIELARNIDRLPSELAARATVALRRDLDLAEAALGGGISVTFTPRRALSLRTASDGRSSSAVTISAPIEVEAERNVDFQIDDIVDVRVSVGDGERRRQAETLRAKWMAEGAPVLARAEAPDVASLEAAMIRHGEEGRLLDAKRREIEALRERISARESRAAELESTAASTTERENALIGCDRAMLEQSYAKLGKHWEIEAEHLVAESERAWSRQREALVAFERDVAGLEAVAELADVQRRAAAAARDGALASAGPDPSALVAAATSEIDAATRENDFVRESLLRLTEGNNAEVEETHHALALARARATELESARAAAELAAIEARSIEDRAAGELATLRDRVAELKKSEAEAEVTAREGELEAFGAVVETPTMQDVEAAKVTVADLQARHGEKTRELDAAEGALQQVGGATLRDQVVEVTRAKEKHFEHENEIRIEADAWKLLREKLEEAEQSEGVHLGRALGAPVTERLSELTEGRYGSLVLSPTLTAETIAVRGGGAPNGALSSLSVGTIEQLATLVRIAIAEQLKSAIVLDDHLVQSDRPRLEWFRRMLRRAATHIQILVLTCRPEDYLDPGEIPGDVDTTKDLAAGAVRAINLAHIIRRWDPGAADRPATTAPTPTTSLAG